MFKKTMERPDPIKQLKARGIVLRLSESNESLVSGSNFPGKEVGAGGRSKSECVSR